MLVRTMPVVATDAAIDAARRINVAAWVEREMGEAKIVRFVGARSTVVRLLDEMGLPADTIE